MTVPGVQQDSYSTLRKRWYSTYLAVEKKYDAQVKKLLIDGANDAQRRIEELSTKTSFSSGVRLAQVRLAYNEAAASLHDVFGHILPVVRSGQGEAAVVATNALTATDRSYLFAAFGNSDSVAHYYTIERASAQSGVNAAIASLTKSDIPLSRKVYKSEALAKHWVKRDVTNSILRGDSARELAQIVRKHIDPKTPGGSAYAARRLAQTEINNAFHATSLAQMKDRPWIESVTWNLSTVHDFDPNHSEICETYSKRSWTPDIVPAKPHPFCRCFVTPVVESLDVFTRHLTAGQYRDWIENAA